VNDTNLISQIKKTAEIISAGGVVGCPTESVYGLSCDPSNQDALTRVLNIKQRDISKGLILVAGDLSYFADYIQPLSDKNIKLIEQELVFKNGKKTRACSWLVSAKNNVMPEISGVINNNIKIVIRLTAHPVLKGITDILKQPIISTSANISGKAPCESYSDMLKVFNKNYNSLDYIINSECWNLAPSSIKDLITGKILR